MTLCAHLSRTPCTVQRINLVRMSNAHSNAQNTTIRSTNQMARCITYTKHSSDSTLIVVDTSPLPAANIMLRLATQPPGCMVFKRATHQSASQVHGPHPAASLPGAGILHGQAIKFSCNNSLAMTSAAQLAGSWFCGCANISLVDSVVDHRRDAAVIAQYVEAQPTAPWCLNEIGGSLG